MLGFIAAGLIGLSSPAYPSAPSPSSACHPVEGSEALWRDDIRYVVIGEVHGTTEIPAIFADLVCAARAQGPVTVALEMPVDIQPTLDAFMSAPTEVEARAALAAYPYGTFVHHDGRGSEAMLDLLLSLRRMSRDDSRLRVRAFIPDIPRDQAPSPSDVDRGMGLYLTTLARQQADGRVLVLTGRAHARKTQAPRRSLVPAISHLPIDEVISLDFAPQGGTYWACVGANTACGPQAFPGNPNVQDRRISLSPQPGGGFDGFLMLGRTTASGPAKP